MMRAASVPRVLAQDCSRVLLVLAVINPVNLVRAATSPVVVISLVAVTSLVLKVRVVINPVVVISLVAVTSLVLKVMVAISPVAVISLVAVTSLVLRVRAAISPVAVISSVVAIIPMEAIIISLIRVVSHMVLLLIRNSVSIQPTTIRMPNTA
jgi:hypothetical protein